MISPKLRLSLAALAGAVGLAFASAAHADFQGVCQPNQVVAGPQSGQPEPPQCRPLTVKDIPSSFIPGAQAASVTPAFYGCTDSNGGTDDTVCIQNAINTASAAGLCLFFDTSHLYQITATLNLAVPPCLLGPYRYGIWVVNQPTNTGPIKCPWGLVTNNTGITLLNASAVTGTIKGLCLDMSGGNAAVNPPSGAAIQIAPPSFTTFSSGWQVEQNTILNPYDGITIPGNGAGAACCGSGTSADGDALLRNTIVNPADAAIAIGKNSAALTGGPGTVGITVTDNDILCKNATSQANAYGIVIYEGAIWYDGTQNGPVGCHIGTALIPGTLSGQGQAVEFNGDGVFGDQSGGYNLLVQPQTGGAVVPVTIGGKGPWANASAPTAGNILIDGTAGGTIQEITINGIYASAGMSATHPSVDVEGGANGPYDLNISNSLFCGQGTVTGTTALKLNAGAGATGRWTIGGNHIGTGCLAGRAVDTGIALTINSGSTSHGSISITGNDISVATTPIAYTPAAADHVIIKNNMGVDDVAVTAITAATSITLPNASPTYAIAGATTITTILGAWQGREVDLVSTSTAINLNTGGNICAAGAGAPYYHLKWVPGATCWEHAP